MNLKQLSKNVRQHLRLRPLPHRIDQNGRRLKSLDDLWRLEAIFDNPNRVRLVNIHTHHFVELQSDNVKQFQSPDFLMLKCQLALRPAEVVIEPLPAAGRPLLPIARYQVRGTPAITSQHVPFGAVICDGCTAAVQFRPLTRIQLMSRDEPLQQPEQFCPPCARKRGIAVPLPQGMADAVLFADTNPSFRYHISGLLTRRTNLVGNS